LVKAETILQEALHEAYYSQMTPFALNALAYLADLLARQGKYAAAARMAVFVTNHNAAVPDAVEVAAGVITAVTLHLSAAQSQQAQENGRVANFTDFLPELF
jgi:uncharacterized protein YecE (DUF72 family)